MVDLGAFFDVESVMIEKSILQMCQWPIWLPLLLDQGYNASSWWEWCDGLICDSWQHLQGAFAWNSFCFFSFVLSQSGKD
jgi:hypothetical protein